MAGFGIRGAMRNRELLLMSGTELDRVAVLQRVLEKRLTRRQAAEQLGISPRQARRLAKALETGGPSALVHKRRGRPGNRALPVELRDRAVALIRERYHDFGPTLAREKLAEQAAVDLHERAEARAPISRLILPRALRPRHLKVQPPPSTS